jgi:hypothetical protein
MLRRCRYACAHLAKPHWSRAGKDCFLSETCSQNRTIARHRIQNRRSGVVNASKPSDVALVPQNRAICAPVFLPSRPPKARLRFESSTVRLPPCRVLDPARGGLRSLRRTAISARCPRRSNRSVSDDLYVRSGHLRIFVRNGWGLRTTRTKLRRLTCPRPKAKTPANQITRNRAFRGRQTDEELEANGSDFPDFS